MKKLSLSHKENIHQSFKSGFLHHFFMTAILIYTLFLSITGTSLHTNQASNFIRITDDLFLIIFACEIILRIYCHPSKLHQQGWNMLDLSILFLSFMQPHVKVLRVLRLFVYLEEFINIKPIQRVIHTFVNSLGSLVSSTLILGVVLYSGGLLSTLLFGEKFPQWFGHIGRSLYTLFQIMTGESWSEGIVRPVMAVYPWAWVPFISFIILTTYGILNIFVGAIVNSMRAVDEDQFNGTTNEELKAEIISLKKMLKK